MTDVREYKVVVLEDADEQTMLKEQFRLDEMGCDEWNVMDCCEEIYKKLEKIDDWKRKISRVENGFKNRMK